MMQTDDAGAVTLEVAKCNTATGKSHRNGCGFVPHYSACIMGALILFSPLHSPDICQDGVH